LRYLPRTVQVGLIDTLSPKVLEIARNFMNKPVLVAVKTEHSLVGIQQYYLDVEKEEWKLGALLDMYEDFDFKRVKSLIYVNTPDKVNLLNSHLGRLDHHNYKVVTTRKASCVDLRHVSFVINYDIPTEPAELVTEDSLGKDMSQLTSLPTRRRSF
jgi:superfamily II DNA/RNA helicase